MLVIQQLVNGEYVYRNIKRYRESIYFLGVKYDAYFDV